MRGHHEEEKENSERWLLTYSDLITLLLVFFIIMYSMSNLDKEKYKKMMESLGNAFGGKKSGDVVAAGGEGASAGAIVSMPPLNSDSLSASVSPAASPDGGLGNALEVEKMEDIKGQVDKMLGNANLKNDVTVVMQERGLVISINSRVLFDSGSAVLKPEFKAIVLKIANVLTPLADNQISVEGHTDNAPIHTYQYPDNWSLSSARAYSVLAILLQNKSLKPTRLMATGYGEYRPIATNDTADGRAKNRRVNIVILKNDFNKGIDINTQAPGTATPSPASSAASTPAPTETPVESAQLTASPAAS